MVDLVLQAARGRPWRVGARPAAAGPRRCPMAVLGMVVSLSGVATVAAQDPGCIQGGQDFETSPGDGATDVALDAPVIVRFTEPAVSPDTGAEALQLFLLPEPLDARADPPAEPPAPTAVQGEVQRLNPFSLAFVPSDQLLADRSYFFAVQFPGQPEPYESDFRTGRQTDRQAPAVTIRDDDVGLTSGPARAACGLAEGAYIVDLDLPAAVDDADNGALQYYLFLTRAHGLELPRLLDRVRRAGASGRVVFRFVLEAEEVVEPVCVVLRVMDGVGRRAEVEPELCFDPRQGTFFQPLCRVEAVGRRGRQPHVAWAFLVSLVLARLGLRRSRR